MINKHIVGVVNISASKGQENSFTLVYKDSLTSGPKMCKIEHAH